MQLAVGYQNATGNRKTRIQGLGMGTDRSSEIRQQALFDLYGSRFDP